MPGAVVQVKAVAVNTAGSPATVTFDAPATAGNTIVILYGGDDYVTLANRPSGTTEPTGARQETNLGHYAWYKTAAGGETSFSCTPGSAVTYCMIAIEVSGVGALNASNGSSGGSSNTVTTPTVTASAGNRYAIATVGGAVASAFPGGMGAWTNGFTEIADVENTLGSGTRDGLGAAVLSYVSDGVTGISTTATWDSAFSTQTTSGILLIFNEGGGTTAAGEVHAHWRLVPPDNTAPSSVYPPFPISTYYDPSLGAASVATPTATEAAGAGTAPDAGTASAASTTEGAGTGSALDATVQTGVVPAAAIATGTGTAPDAAVTASANAEVPSGTGSAPDASVTTSAAPAAIEATGTGSALDATVQTSVSGSPTAGNAAGTGTGHDAAVSIAADLGQVRTVFGGSSPVQTNNADATTYTMGTRFKPLISGYVSAVRWFVPSTLPGASYQPTAVQLWHNPSSSIIATTTLTPVAGGWSTGAFSVPVAVTGGVEYTVSVVTDRYTATTGFFAATITGDQIETAPASGRFVDIGAGGTTPAFPNAAFGDAGYFVDPVFSAVIPPSGAGTAPDATVSTSTTTSAPATEAAGTGAAYDATVSTTSNVSASATEAAGTGTAYSATAALGPGAIEGTAAGTAEWDTGSNISLDMVADNPVDGVGTAYDAAISTASSTSASAVEATGTGTANAATALTGAQAEGPIEVGQAFDATVQTTSQTNAAATEAAGVGVAPDAAASVVTGATEGAGAGSAADATVQTSVSGAPGAGLADSAGTALDASTGISIPAGTASGTGTAADPAVTAQPVTNAPASEGAAGATAYDASVGVTAGALTAVALGTADDQGGTPVFLVGVASGSGTAADASVTVLFTAGLAVAMGAAFGTGTSYDAPVIIVGFSYVDAAGTISDESNYMRVE